jgi:hypothetical protein
LFSLSSSGLLATWEHQATKGRLHLVYSVPSLHRLEEKKVCSWTKQQEGLLLDNATRRSALGQCNKKVCSWTKQQEGLLLDNATRRSALGQSNKKVCSWTMQQDKQHQNSSCLHQDFIVSNIKEIAPRVWI